MEDHRLEESPPEDGPDFYAAHLAEVNDTREVVSTQDIVNSRGVLLCRRGMRIDHEVADRLVRHKLVQPLENQVQIANSVDSSSLHAMLQQLLERMPDLRQTHENCAIDALCEEAFLRWPLPPVLTQKITVMQERMPKQLEKGVFCAWLALLTGRELALARDDLQALFTAALIHDMGFLHLDPQILSKKGALTPAEWRAIQSHVVVGKIVLESIDDMHPRTARAVLEHHERCDGTGYPTGRPEPQLDRLGQVVGLTDSAQSIRVHQFEPCGRNLRDLLPYLQMNSHTYFYDVYQAMHAVLNNSGLQPTVTHPDADVAAMAAEMLAKGRALHHIVAILRERNVPELAEDLRGKNRGGAVFRVANHLLDMTTRSGVVSDELCLWLESLRTQPDPAALMELNELQLMLNELHWQLNNATKAFNAFFDSSCAETSAEHAALKQIAAEVEACLQKIGG